MTEGQIKQSSMTQLILLICTPHFKFLLHWQFRWQAHSLVVTSISLVSFCLITTTQQITDTVFLHLFINTLPLWFWQEFDAKLQIKCQRVKRDSCVFQHKQHMDMLNTHKEGIIYSGVNFLHICWRTEQRQSDAPPMLPSDQIPAGNKHVWDSYWHVVSSFIIQKMNQRAFTLETADIGRPISLE